MNEVTAVTHLRYCGPFPPSLLAMLNQAILRRYAFQFIDLSMSISAMIGGDMPRFSLLVFGQLTYFATDQTMNSK